MRNSCELAKGQKPTPYGKLAVRNRRGCKSLRARSVILKASHPFRPVFGVDAAGLGPDVGRAELAMPPECPQFLKPDLPDRTAIQKKAVYIAVMPVDADQTHLAAGCFLELSRAVGVTWVNVKPGAIKK